VPQRCDRSAARINSLLRTYNSRFGLRYSPPTLFNIAFTAGTTHLLSAVRHHGSKVKDGAVTSARECVEFLNSVAESWPAAAQKADILDTLVKEYHPHAQSASFEQAVTMETVPAMRGSDASVAPQQQIKQTSQTSQPIPMQRQQAPTYTTHESMLSNDFSSSYTDEPWQFSPPYPQPQSFTAASAM
jgi:hypothetical protein